MSHFWRVVKKLVAYATQLLFLKVISSATVGFMFPVRFG